METHILKGLCAVLAVIASGCVQPQTRPEVPLSSEVLDLDGGSHVLGSGRQMLVFWQPSCKSCREHNPEVVALWREKKAEVEVISVCCARGTAEEAKATAAAWGIEFPTIHDPDLAVSRRFGVSGTPTILVFREGKEVYRGHRLPEDVSALLGPRLATLDPVETGAGPEEGASCVDGVCELGAVH